MTHVLTDASAGPAAEPNAPPPDLTVLVLASERAENLTSFYEEYITPLASLGKSIEVVFAAEGWLRHLADEVKPLALAGARVHVLLAAQRMGETGLIRMALPYCRSQSIVIMSAYRRIEASALPNVIRALDGADLVVARRWPRRDSWVNRLQGRIFHGAVSVISQGEFHDLGSGVRAMRRQVLDDIPVYGESYRFLPILAYRDGFTVREVDCPQHPDDKRMRVHAPGVYLRRALDLLGLYFLVRFTEKPLRFFGLVGSGISLVGAIVLAMIVVQRIGGRAAGDRPLLLLGVLLAVLGVQAIALGLIGEIIVHLHATRYRRYRVARPTHLLP